jgi:hypothetical protein
MFTDLAAAEKRAAEAEARPTQWAYDRVCEARTKWQLAAEETGREIAALRAEVARLKRMAGYARHSFYCKGGKDCDCGFDAALAPEPPKVPEPTMVWTPDGYACGCGFFGDEVVAEAHRKATGHLFSSRGPVDRHGVAIDEERWVCRGCGADLGLERLKSTGTVWQHYTGARWCGPVERQP